MNRGPCKLACIRARIQLEKGGGTPPKAQTESCEAAKGAGSAGLGLAARGRSAERESAGKAERGSIENRRAVSEIYLEPLFFLVEIQKI